MKVIKSNPPNFELIKACGLAKEGNIYCWGNTIFNPLGVEIPSDILYHESIHEKQQGKDIQGWWNKYCTDSKFRLAQETEAYSAQYRKIKEILPDKIAKDFLDEFAYNLSTLYGIMITKSQAETMIRKYQNVGTNGKKIIKFLNS